MFKSSNPARYVYFFSDKKTDVIGGIIFIIALMDDSEAILFNG